MFNKMSSLDEKKSARPNRAFADEGDGLIFAAVLIRSGFYSFQNYVNLLTGIYPQSGIFSNYSSKFYINMADEETYNRNLSYFLLDSFRILYQPIPLIFTAN